MEWLMISNIGNQKCSMCHMTLRENGGSDEGFLKLPCGHYFHVRCFSDTSKSHVHAAAEKRIFKCLDCDKVAFASGPNDVEENIKKYTEIKVFPPATGIRFATYLGVAAIVSILAFLTFSPMLAATLSAIGTTVFCYGIGILIDKYLSQPTNPQKNPA